LAADLTQEQLALAAGIDRSFLSLIERGQRQPTVRIAFQIAKALPMRLSELIRLTENYIEDQ
jgi:transcriptional regulator with XRE-family HTH domain